MAVANARERGPALTDLGACLAKVERYHAGPGNAEIMAKPDYSASYFHNAVERARCALENADPQERECADADMQAATVARQQFWIDCCRTERRMRLASPQVLEFHRKYGCRFLEPGAKQVQQILDALDAAMPFWDQEFPALFFQTLELNFPEAVHHQRREYHTRVVH